MLVRSLNFTRSFIQNNPFYIVAYHNIVKNFSAPFLFDINNVSCCKDAFEEQLIFYKDNFNVIKYSELEGRTLGTHRSKPDLVITFDDGYESFYEIASPLLKKHNLLATVFLPTDYIGSNRLFWWDEVAYLCNKISCQQFFHADFSEYFIPDSMIEYEMNSGISEMFIRVVLRYLKSQSSDDIFQFQKKLHEKHKDLFEKAHKISKSVRLMNWQQVKELSENGIEFGSHTMSHLQFDQCDDLDRIDRELRVSKEKIEKECGKTINTFCYPASRISSGSDNIVHLLDKHNYKYACLMSSGLNDTSGDSYFHNRLAVTSEMSNKELALRLSLPEAYNAKENVKKIYLSSSMKMDKLRIATRLLPYSLKSKNAQMNKVKHLFIAICDHYEPYWHKASHNEAYKRVKQWVDKLPKIFENYKDSDGRNPIYSFFYPEEEYRKELLDMIASICQEGFGEVEIHLHHDCDNSDNLRKRLTTFKKRLMNDHGLLSKNPTTDEIVYGFIHGNWALDNSHPSGRWCGVNDEITILKETGCYADFTMPSAPSHCQTKIINSIYYALDDPFKPMSHNTGKLAVANSKIQDGLLIIQGPLILRRNGLSFKIENSEITYANYITPERVASWLTCGISVKNKPDWVFIKLHAHGTQESTMNRLFELGHFDSIFTIFEEKAVQYNAKLHYVSTRQMTNVIHAIEEGAEKWSWDLLDYRYCLL